MVGTTIETSIRFMSRWGKENLVRTEKEGFLVVDRPGLETIALTLPIARFWTVRHAVCPR